VGPGREFKTIADALASSRPGDTVSVAPGRYRERVRLEEGVTLVGAPGKTVLAPATDGSGALAAVVIEGLGSGRVADLSIEAAEPGALDYGIVIHSSSVAVENVEIRGARVAAIAFDGPSAPTIVACNLHDNPGAGIVVRGNAAPRILGNRVVDNGRSSAAAPGIDLDLVAHGRLVGNVIVGNGAEGVRGVRAEDRASVLESNVFAVAGKTNRRGAVRAAAEGAP
jgi:hypothetical protein